MYYVFYDMQPGWKSSFVVSKWLEKIVWYTVVVEDTLWSYFFLTATRITAGRQARNSTNAHSVNPHPDKHPLANLSDDTPSSQSFVAQPAETIQVLLNISECTSPSEYK